MEHPADRFREKVRRFPVAALLLALGAGLLVGISTGAAPRGRAQELSAQLATAREDAARQRSQDAAGLERMANEQLMLEGRISDLQGEIDALASRVIIPSLTGLNLRTARDGLLGSGLDLIVRKRASSEPPGTVLSQSPADGSYAEAGETVTVVVAKPRPQPPAPEIVEDPPEPLDGPCDPNYSGGCVPLVSGDLDCADISGSVSIVGSDPHGFDGDGDGTGCE
jgi:hypothetical protein